MRLYIIRHGETDWNKEKRLQGQSDIKLNENGIKLAQITAEHFKDISFDTVYSSPLIRAFETARIITGGRYDIITDDRLKEISFGTDEGVLVDERREDFMDFFFNPDKYRPAKGGETYMQLTDRAKDFLDEKIYPFADTNRQVAVFAHGAMNKALMLVLRKLEIADIWKGEFQQNCCVNVLDIKGDRAELIEEAKIYYELNDNIS